MAFEIAQPNVGKTLLATFSTLAEENRKAREFELRQSKVAQDTLLKSELQNVRERALDLRGTAIANQSEIAQAKLGLLKIASDNKAEKDKLDAKLKALQFQQKQDDFQAAGELTGILSVPGADGRNLNQQLFSPDEKERAEALDIWAKHTSRLRGRGPMTEKAIGAIESQFNADQRMILARKNAELSAQREARMAADQAADNTRADKGLSLREKEAAARQAAAAAKVATGGKSGAAKVTYTKDSEGKEKRVIAGTPQQIAASKRIDELLKRGDTGEKNALGESMDQELARLRAQLAGAQPSPAPAPAPASGVPAIAEQPRPIPGRIYRSASDPTKKRRWIGGTDGDINDDANWEAVP